MNKHKIPLKNIIIMLMLTTLIISMFVGCGSNKAAKTGTKGMTVLIREMDTQDKYFRENIIKPFEKEHGVKINVVSFDAYSDIDSMIKLEMSTGKKTIGLFETPSSEASILLGKKMVYPLEEVVNKDQLQKDLSEYVESSLKVGSVDGKNYFIPRKMELNTMVYLKSKVSDAIKNWSKYKNEINDMVKKENGYGLPDGYTLNNDPNEWDSYDVAVASYYWKNTDYNGLKSPRTAHRGKNYESSVDDLMTGIYGYNGTAQDMLTMNTAPVKDYYKWESFMASNKLYNSSMWEQEWSGGSIWKAFSNEQVFLALYMSQMDEFNIHGGSNPEMTGYLNNPSDMGVAMVPAGVSLEMKDGKPARVGNHVSGNFEWVWGIPKTSPDAKLSYELVRWITSKEVQKQECQIFGIAPIRKDVLNDIKSFKEPWMGEIFEAANKQGQQKNLEIPNVPEWYQAGQVYLDMWFDIIKNGKNVDKAIEEYTPKLEEKIK